MEQCYLFDDYFFFLTPHSKKLATFPHAIGHFYGILEVDVNVHIVPEQFKIQ